MSDLINYYNKVVNRWYGGSSRKFIEYAISRINREWGDKSIFIVEAPTGYGKSAISAAISLYSIFEEFKSIIAFPLRALLEDQYEKFKRVIPEYMLGKRYMHTHESPYLIHPVTLTTIDTLSLTVFGISPEDLNKVVKKYLGTSIGSFGHYWFSWASVALSNIVLDEAHLVADSSKSLNFLLALMDFVVRHDSKLILMSATLPRVLKKELVDELGYPEKVSVIEFTKNWEGYDDEFVSERKRKKYNVYIEPLHGEEKFDKIAHWILKNSGSFDRVIVVFNTAEDAITFYGKIRGIKEFEDYFKIVLHSRFSDVDRKAKVSHLGKLGDVEKYIVVSTQTIEAGVDISSTLFITEIAPANSLIQRLGRFLRYDENEGEAYIWYEVDSDGKLLSWNTNGIKMYKVYDFTLTDKTLKFLRCRGKLDFHVPEDYSVLLDNVYAQEDFRINKGHVRRLINILLSYEEASIKAVKEFMRLEGSFVRDGLIVPVIAEDVVKKFSLENTIILSSSELKKNIVPLSYNLLRKCYSGRIVSKEGSVYIVKELNENYISYPSRIIKLAFSENIKAFIVRGTYDSENGLRVIGG